MRRLFTLGFVGMLLSLFFSCEAQDSYRLTGKVQDLANGSTVTLSLAATHADEEIEAETTVQNGQFVFEGQLPEPRLYTMVITEPTGAQAYVQIMLENGNITFSAVKQSGADNRYMTLTEIKVEGSEADKLYREKMAMRDGLDKMYSDYHEKHQDILNKISEARKAGNQTLLDKLTNSDAYAVFAKAEHDFFDTVGKTINGAIVANGDSYWGPLLMLCNYNFFAPNDTASQQVYNNFSDAAKNSFYGQILKKQLFVESLKGKTLPEFILPDRDGKEFADATLREGKKCVLLDFWASWCGPCRKSIPQLKEIYGKYADQGLEIISISIDKNKADWTKAVDEEQLPWCCLLDTKNVFNEKYNGRAVPTFVLVDGQGIVVNDMLSVGELESAIQQQLGV